jgi:protein KRI1
LIPSCAVKEKYGSDADTDDSNSDDSDSESDESEDEDGEELTPALDVAILRTLARIKARDPGIYDTGCGVFEGMSPPPLPFFLSLPPARFSYANILTEEHSQSRTLPAPSRTKKAKSDKPVTLHEQRLAAALDIATTRSSSPEAPSPPPPPTHVAEQAALRTETIAAFHSGAADTGYAERQEEGGLFTLREKTRDEVEQEEAEYRAYLEREVGPLEKILDLGEEEKAEEWILRKEEEDMRVPLGEADSGKKKKKKKGKQIVERREETDQEFLIKCVCSQHSIPHNISNKRYFDFYFFL